MFINFLKEYKKQKKGKKMEKNKNKIIALAIILIVVIGLRFVVGSVVESTGEKEILKKVETNFFLKTVSLETESGKKYVLALNKAENILPTTFSEHETISVGTFGVSAHHLFYRYSLWNFLPF